MTGPKGLSIRLNNSDRDMVIRAWLESVTTDPNVRVSEIVKGHLYNVAIGAHADPATNAIIDVIRSEFARLPAMIRIQGGTVADAETTPDDSDEIARRLGAMPD